MTTRSEFKPYRPKTREETARNMSQIRASDNKTELALRRALHSLGLRYRKHYARLPGKPDIVFPTERIAIFVDGDLWHGRMLIEQGIDALRERMNRKNPEYWIPKITRTVERDTTITATLSEAGWLVLRYWESDIKNVIPSVAHAISEHVAVRRRSVPPVRPR